jgi:hypothetical protein
MTTFEETAKKIEAAGYSWAVEGHPGGDYSAVVEFGPRQYIAQSLADGHQNEGGATPAEALEKAYARELASNPGTDPNKPLNLEWEHGTNSLNDPWMEPIKPGVEFFSCKGFKPFRIEGVWNDVHWSIRPPKDDKGAK